MINEVNRYLILTKFIFKSTILSRLLLPPLPIFSRLHWSNV